VKSSKQNLKLFTKKKMEENFLSRCMIQQSGTPMMKQNFMKRQKKSAFLPQEMKMSVHSENYL